MKKAGHKSPPTVLPSATQLSSPPATPEPAKGRKRKAAKAGIDDASADSSTQLPVTPNPQKCTRTAKYATASKVQVKDTTELPHNLGPISGLNTAEASILNTPPKSTNKPRKSTKAQAAKTESVQESVASLTSVSENPIPEAKKKKGNTYGITLGQTPYPNYARPTPEECFEVNRLLSSIHGEVKPPETIPLPSLTVAGCGEVPSVLDALLRTLLSGATHGDNSSRAYAGLIARFGTIQDGVGKGSLDWNKVRLGGQNEVFKAIKSGGLAQVKSTAISKILEMVFEENRASRDKLLATADTEGSSAASLEQLDMEVIKADQDVLSLDHMHHLSKDEAYKALIKYPSIGAKTAACVMLFCLQHPTFAVDTHVFRMCKWLGWVPSAGDSAGLPEGAKGKFSGPTRDSTFAHLDFRIPDDLKYPLHQLFYHHGRTCPKCKAVTGENSTGWDEGCVLDHLVKRTGNRKDAGPSPSKEKSTSEKKSKGAKSSTKKVRKEDGGSEHSETKTEEGADELTETKVKDETSKQDAFRVEDEDSELSDVPESEDEGSVYGGST